MTLKFSRAAALRPWAEQAIDDHFSALIAAELGPVSALHALKRAQAIAGSGPLIDGDREAILARASEQDARLAEMDRQRRAMKAQMRAATTATEIQELVGRLPQPASNFANGATR